MDCNNFVDLWVKWTSTGVQLGTGEVIGSDPLLSYTNTTAGINEVNYVSMTGYEHTNRTVECRLGTYISYKILVLTVLVGVM